jgi:hypothetical protein
MPQHTRRGARLATWACAPRTPGSSVTGAAAPSTRKRKPKRGGAHQDDADDTAGLICLPKDLLLCVVRAVRRRMHALRRQAATTHARCCAPTSHRARSVACRRCSRKRAS